MTSDLEQIAEEMGACENVGSGDGRHAKLLILVISWAERLRAWIAANKESPQRKAFVEAAMELEEWFDVTGKEWSWKEPHSLRPESSDAFLRRDAAIHKFVNARRAMIEAKKVEAERGEGT